MTELGTCKNSYRGPHEQTRHCLDWQPLSAKTPRVEIWRFNDNTLTVARSDGACWNGPDTMFSNVRHEGYWDSNLMRFVNDEGAEVSRFLTDNHKFTDGTPVALYESDEVKQLIMADDRKRDIV